MLSIPKHSLKILVIGGGGREHALVWKLAQSPLVEKVFCAPGNGGTATENKSENVDIKIDEFAKLSQFCLDQKIDLTVVGPDNALAAGIVDYFKEKSLRIFGPSKAAARLEWSKSYAKQFMAKYNLPTAKFLTCNSYNDALRIAKANAWAQVIKVDGLALGKGVYVCNNKDSVENSLKEIFEENKFGHAAETVLFEEKLNGEEMSLFLLCDGKDILPLAPSQDFKRRFDDDCGPNTGGMGAISPPANYDKFKDIFFESIFKPLQTALRSEAINYQGLLYIGVLLHQDQASGQIQPKILEFNARFGDPETQAVLLRLKSDLLPALWACTEGKLAEINLEWSEEKSCCVIAVNSDYPEKSSNDKTITIPSQSPEKIIVFHAGTKLKDKNLVTAGGRVLAVVALNAHLEQAAKKTYDYLANLNFESMDYRKDIGRLKSKIH